MNNKKRNIFDFLGRLCLSSTFAIAIPPKVIHFQDFVNSISVQGIPDPLAIFLLISAIICLIFGVGFTLFRADLTIGASFLLIFLVPTTIIMHINPFQTLTVFMNLGLIGGLLIALSRAKFLNSLDAGDSMNKFFKDLIKLIKRLILK